MTEPIIKKAEIEVLLQAGHKPHEIAKMLGVARRYAVAVAWRMRNPERAKAIKRAGEERRRADPEWLGNERERRRKRHKARRRDREYRRNLAQARFRRRLRKLRAQAHAQESG